MEEYIYIRTREVNINDRQREDAVVCDVGNEIGVALS
jgi:hypothetical protein